MIDFVISDHSPCTPELKLPERGDFHEAWGGIASLQLGLAAMWTEARRRGAHLGQLAAWMSARPAAFMGWRGTKGCIAPGFDADLVIWDPDETYSPQADDLFSRHRISPYLGASLKGRVWRTLVRGDVVYDGRGHPAGPSGRPLMHRKTPAGGPS